MWYFTDKLWQIHRKRPKNGVRTNLWRMAELISCESVSVYTDVNVIIILWSCIDTSTQVLVLYSYRVGNVSWWENEVWAIYVHGDAYTIVIDQHITAIAWITINLCFIFCNKLWLWSSLTSPKYVTFIGTQWHNLAWLVRVTGYPHLMPTSPNAQLATVCETKWRQLTPLCE